MFRNNAGWTRGKADESFLIYDVDMLEPWFLINTIKSRAGIEHDFKLAMCEPGDVRYYEDDGKPAITPSMILALLAIGVAWHLVKNITQGYVKPKSRLASSELLKANKLLKAANAAELHQKTARELRNKERNKEKSKLHGRDGYDQGIGKKHNEAHNKHESWQSMTDEIRSKHPSLKKTAIAKIIAKRTGDKANTIRRRIILK